MNGKISTSTNAKLVIERCRPEAALWSFESKVEPCKIFVGHVKKEVKKAELRAAFSKFGKIKDIRVAGKVKDVYNAYIEFEEEQCAKDSIAAMDQSLIGGGKIKVGISDPSSKVLPYDILINMIDWLNCLSRIYHSTNTTQQTSETSFRHTEKSQTLISPFTRKV